MKKIRLKWQKTASCSVCQKDCKGMYVEQWLFLVYTKQRKWSINHKLQRSRIDLLWTSKIWARTTKKDHLIRIKKDDAVGGLVHSTHHHHEWLNLIVHSLFVKLTSERECGSLCITRSGKKWLERTSIAVIWLVAETICRGVESKES